VPASSSLIVPASGCTMVDLFAQYELSEYELSDRETVDLNIDNLFDKTYLQYLDLQNDPGFNARIGSPCG
jgi:outer membrane receptor protein involved in Fe transport